MLIATVTLLLTVVLFLFGTAVVKRIESVSRAWEEYNRHAAFVSKKLFELEKSFGYGGFIHNFKNFVLRQDTSRIPMIEKNLSDTYRVLNEYRANETVGKITRRALVRFKDVVDKYADKFRLAKKLVAEGASPKVIDARVRVDDRPALEALEAISVHQVEHHGEIERETSRALAGALGLAGWGVLLLPLVLLTGLAMILSLKKVCIYNSELAETREYLDDLIEGMPDATLIVTSRGKIRRVNLEAVKLLKYSKDELQALGIEDLMPERFRAMHGAMRDKTFSHPSDRPLMTGADFVARDKGGNEIPVDISLSFSRQGEERIAIVTLRDVTEQRRAERALKNSEGMLNKAQQIARIGSWDWIIEDQSLHWSDEIYRIFGLEPGEFGANYDAFIERVHPEDRELVNQSVQAAIAHSQPYRIKHRITRADTGEERMVMEEAEVLRNELGIPYRMVGTVQDITDSIQADKQLLLAGKVFENTLEAILIMDGDALITEVNDAFCRLCGYGRTELLGQSISILRSGYHSRGGFDEVMAALDEADDWRGEVWTRSKDGLLSPCMASVSAVKDITGKVHHYVVAFLDVSAMKQDHAQLERLAHYDQLTGLANRFVFNDRLRASIRRVHRNNGEMAVLYIDLDGFKAVNDRFGHEEGDDVLVRAARNIRQCLREDDTVARLGGDEFAVILNDLHEPGEIEDIAGRIVEALQIEVEAEPENLKVTGSVGIAVYPVDSDEEEALLRCADQAMYHAKKRGKNNYCFFGKM